jgi:hypothetical protein
VDIVISLIGKKRLLLLRGYLRMRSPDRERDLDAIRTIHLRRTVGLSRVVSLNDLEDCSRTGLTSRSTRARGLTDMPRRSDPRNPMRMAKQSS